MVSKAADAAVWEDLKDIKPPMYDGNPLNLDRFLEKLDDWGLTVTEDMPPADAEKYVFRWFRYRLPEVLGELYFSATKEGRIKTLKEAKKWLNEQERVDASQVAAKRWKSIELQHDGREIRLRDWRDFRGHYTLLRRNVEDWNEGDEQARLLSMLPEAWIKRVTKEESKRAKSNHTVKMMLPKEYHTNVVALTRKNVARDVKRHSLRNALLITSPLWTIVNQVARSQQKNIKNHEKDAQPAKIKRKIDFSDVRNPQKHFTPLFGEVAKFRTLTEKAEQQSRDGDEVERCLPQNT